jgi:hypothetical protein
LTFQNNLRLKLRKGACGCSPGRNYLSADYGVGEATSF